MINHVRTLLLNRSGNSGVSPQTPGEEYVPPSYRARQLPGFLNTALAIVLGSNPDRIYLNYRIRQLMQLIHATELENHVLALDPRISYDLYDTQFFADTFRLNYQQFAGAPSRLYGFGEHYADDAVGKVQQQWLLTVLDGNTASIQRLTPPASQYEVSLNILDGLTDYLPLQGTGLRVRLGQPGTGDAWEITSRARPVQDISSLLLHMTTVLGESGINRLLAGDDEPLVTYRKLWHQQELFAYRYGALLLAIARFIERLPQQPE